MPFQWPSELEVEQVPWQDVLALAIKMYVTQTVGNRLSNVHTEQTPRRVVKAYSEFISGYSDDPTKFLLTSFDDSARCKGMVHCWHLPIVSMCAHHIMPFAGWAHFAYVPKGRVVGLSKIPRFIDVLCRRLQIQENLGEEIVDIFQNTVNPYGCAVTIHAVHNCMSSRGVRVHGVATSYTALRGSFMEGPTRLEYENSRAPQL